MKLSIAKTVSQDPTMITTSGITTASTRYRKALRTSIPAPIVNMLKLEEGQTLVWSQIIVEGRNYITVTGGTKDKQIRSKGDK